LAPARNFVIRTFRRANRRLRFNPNEGVGHGLHAPCPVDTKRTQFDRTKITTPKVVADLCNAQTHKVRHHCILFGIEARITDGSA
jgi:hypothetical protein